MVFFLLLAGSAGGLGASASAFTESAGRTRHVLSESSFFRFSVPRTVSLSTYLEAETHLLHQVHRTGVVLKNNSVDFFKPHIFGDVKHVIDEFGA